MSSRDQKLSYLHRLTASGSPAEGAEAPKAPSKNELKKRAKEEEKARKAAEKAARQAELEAQKAAAEVVSTTAAMHSAARS